MVLYFRHCLSQRDEWYSDLDIATVSPNDAVEDSFDKGIMVDRTCLDTKRGEWRCRFWPLMTELDHVLLGRHNHMR